ncbi:hypothetical protein OQA88_12708 [Cercophora sp. LCS_1]
MTIRDSMLVCEQLGERYLWVDRYCIIQDDDDDRHSQINAMSEIFSAAKLVIVAASSSQGLSGVSRHRPKTTSRFFSGCRVDIQRCHLQDGIDSSLWNSRGWTYQEALLNRRKLFFTDAQIYFECGLRITHEENLSYPSFDPSLHNKDQYIGATTSLTYGDISHGDERLDTSRKLSHTSDLLNAFTGILQALYGKDGTYYGLPLPDFDRALLWTPAWRSAYSPSPTPENKLDNPAFPSWSWASAHAEIPSYELATITGTLCIWFRPVQSNNLEPILPTGNSLKRINYLELKENSHAAEAFLRGTIPDTSALRDGTLITRALVTRLRMKRSASTEERGGENKIIIENEQDVEVGKVLDGAGVVGLLAKGQEMFTFVAISVTVSERARYDGGITDAAMIGSDGRQKITWDSVPVVNVLIVEREGKYLRRIGLAEVDTEARVEVEGVVETVLLV